MTTASKFDFDVDPGHLDVSYRPTSGLRAVINAIARLDDIEFRFWAAMTLYVNMSSVFPCADAEDVVISVLSDALERGTPPDHSYALVMEHGHIAGVAHDSGTAFEPDEDDQMIFNIVAQSDVEKRSEDLVKLAASAAITEENMAHEGRADQGA